MNIFTLSNFIILIIKVIPAPCNQAFSSESVDLIIAVEAYHWFDNEHAKSEFKQILREDGYVILLWNEFGGDLYSRLKAF